MSWLTGFGFSTLDSQVFWELFAPTGGWYHYQMGLLKMQLNFTEFICNFHELSAMNCLHQVLQMKKNSRLSSPVIRHLCLHQCLQHPHVQVGEDRGFVFTKSSIKHDFNPEDVSKNFKVNCPISRSWHYSICLGASWHEVSGTEAQPWDVPVFHLEILPGGKHWRSQPHPANHEAEGLWGQREHLQQPHHEAQWSLRHAKGTRNDQGRIESSV